MSTSCQGKKYFPIYVSFLYPEALYLPRAILFYGKFKLPLEGALWS
jgi:hypothetical protein